jgi:Zn-dependent protease with chaperone function
VSFAQYFRLELYILAGWTLVSLLLILAGMTLSRVTLKAMYQQRPDVPSETGVTGRRVRELYRAVIALTSICFYFSIPLVIVLVAGATGRIVFDQFVEGQVPVHLVVIVEILTFISLVAIFRGLFARSGEENPGRRLTRREAPQLWVLTEEVARRVQTRPVGWIYITPGTEIAVLERGGPLRKLSGRGRRCLLLGLGALPGLRREQFESILAHEYGHFSHRDTAGGDLATRVSQSIRQMGFMLSINGLDKWYNPFWLFLNGFSRIFLRITAGASRLQEMLADRYAALAFGVDQFVGGLEHIVRQSLVFSRQVANEVEVAQRDDRTIRNVYTLPPIDDREQIDQLEKTFAEVMSRDASPYDSHPSPKERVGLLRGLKAGDVKYSENSGLWDLIGDAGQLQDEMTRVIQKNVDTHRAMTTGSAGQTAGA